jgi:sugar phosphate isomerase/epimerase
MTAADMRLGISTYTYGWALGVPGYPPPPSPLTLEGLLEKAAALSVRVVQIADNPRLQQMSDAELDTLREAAGRLRIDLELGTRGIDPDHLRRYLSAAVRLQSPLVRVIIETKNPRASTDDIVATLREVVPDYARAGVSLAIENHDRFPAAALAEILERLDSPHAGLCLDTANSVGCLEGLETLLRVLGRWVVNLHVKDVSVQRLPHRRGFVVEGCPAGQGQVNIPGVLNEFRALGRDPNAILELWPPPEPTMAESIAKEEAWAAESIRYLRRFISD